MKSTLFNSLKELAKHIHQANKEKGFWPPEGRNTGECLMLMTSELGEAMEADRKNLMDSHLPQFKGLYVELVDCLIRILDFLGAMGVDVDAILQAKLEYNKSRPYKHGKEY